jgi:purine-binding chemotaxis protein CheW
MARPLQSEAIVTNGSGGAGNVGSSLSAEARAGEILRARAAVLARPLEVAAGGGDETQFVVFAVGDDRFAIETAFVREVLPLPEVTPLPGAARVFVGIISLRGDIVPVAALERLLGGVGIPLEHSTYLVIVGGERTEIAVLATALHDILSIDPARLSPVNGERNLVRGVMADGLVVLDANAVMNDPRMTIEDEGAEG